MEINNRINVTRIQTSDKVAASNPAPGQQTKAADVSRSPAHVSPDAKVLASASQTLNTLPDVDMDKVNAIRTQLAQGTLNLDLDGLADAIVQQHNGS